MCNIDEILYLIHWDRSDAEQQKGICMAKQVQCIKTFFQPYIPGCSKAVWDNCARIIAMRSDAELIPYTSDMLRWLEDPNHPGAEIILNRLLEIQDTSVLARSIKEIVPVLAARGDSLWLWAISQLLVSDRVRNALDENTRSILEKNRLLD